MIVLGFDTATPATAVGLMLADGHVLEGRDDPGPGERPGHSRRLLPLAHELLRRAQLRWEDIERIAVGIGPGTFTGLRIGVATARGIAQSLGVELVGVSSLRALAHPLHVLPHPLQAQPERVLAAIDARRGEVFIAAYTVAEEELSAARALRPDRLAEVIEPERGSGWTAVGDGAVRFAGQLVELGVDVPPADSPLHAISGRAVCELALHAAPAQTGVLPCYGRAPDAELTRGARAEPAVRGTEV
jgi:tRNA threonylcarbamoyladenosine biosynthesis protein TsaB